ncbi:MAG TPA: DUF6144 family protein [Vicinamibacteria bacterium]|nr:DUF6144 family protein [Vicinamibacteria bacterium]
MDRKEFLGKSLQMAAGLGLGCPCLAAGGDTPATKPDAGPAPASPCPKTSGDYPHATPFEKRADFAKTWAGRFVRVLDERVDETTRHGLMEANGRACAMGAYGPPDPAKKVGVDELVASLAKHVGPENARREGDVVFFNYKQNRAGLRVADGYCLCPLVEDGPADLSATYCHCSVGYVAYMFERSLGRPVRVELLESLRGGGKGCRFAVHV